MPKVTTPTTAGAARRHNPLADDYHTQYPSLKEARPAKRRKSLRENEKEQDAFSNKNTSQKILKISQDLLDEDQVEQERAAAETNNSAFDFGSNYLLEDEHHGNDSEDEANGDDEGAWGDEYGDVEAEDVDPQDLEIFNRFNPPSFDDPILKGEDGDSGQPSTNLAALILEKIAEQEATNGDAHDIQGGGPPEDAIELPAKVVEAFTKIGQLLSRYKSGPLPKLFKALPTLPHWPTLLSITQPDHWTPHAIQAATRIFVSSRPEIAQLFLSDILLPAVRTSIHDTTKVPVQLYAAMKKALYKPAAFFKGLLFPVLASGTATLREAQIISSVLARVSVPVLHSAAALYRLCDIATDQMSRRPESAGAVNLCIRVLLEKKYALPFKVVDALVFHFLRFRTVGANGNAMALDNNKLGTGKLPVIWHQCLLAFATRYKNDITEDQREALLDLLLERGHGAIGPEVRKELLAGRGRGVVVPQGADNGGDDTMVMD